MHSTGRFKGKLTERWGRKATGLRDESAYDSGVAGSNVNPLVDTDQATGPAVRPILAIHTPPPP